MIPALFKVIAESCYNVAVAFTMLLPYIVATVSYIWLRQDLNRHTQDFPGLRWR